MNPPTIRATIEEALLALDAHHGLDSISSPFVRFEVLVAHDSTALRYETWYVLTAGDAIAPRAEIGAVDVAGSREAPVT